MVEWFVQYWLQVLFTVFCGIVCFVARFIWNTLKKEYIDVVKKNQRDLMEVNQKILDLQNNIGEKFDKLNEKIDKNHKESNDKIDKNHKESNETDLAIIRDTLLRKMRYGLNEEHCVTLADFETVSGLMSRYDDLDGNGEIHRLFKKYEKLDFCGNKKDEDD